MNVPAESFQFPSTVCVNAPGSREAPAPMVTWERSIVPPGPNAPEATKSSRPAPATSEVPPPSVNGMSASPLWAVSRLALVSAAPPWLPSLTSLVVRLSPVMLLPVVIVTAYPDGDLMQEAMRHGPVMLLAKPVDPAMLERTVRSALGDRLPCRAGAGTGAGHG